MATRTLKPTKRVTKRAAEQFSLLQTTKIEFISNAVFEQADAADVVLAKQLSPPRPAAASACSTTLNGSRMRRLADFELLPPAEEADTFCQMNYWKHRAARLRDAIDIECPEPRRMDEVRRMLNTAQELRDRIVQANVRLVISVVKKFVDAQNSLDELLSEGLVSLMRAVEKFDYSRGFRFSTYATYAIRRNLYRFVVTRRQERARYEAPPAEFVGDLTDESEARITEQRWHELNRRLTTILRRLDPREQMVIRARFGLDDCAAPETLQSLADRMGVCKERVRQLEKRAMLKLRKMASEAALEDPGE
jgi:RNA polymerase primary sigma factor